MKKIIIGTLVGTVIFFVYESIMWEGGLHDNFSSYTANQSVILNTLGQNLNADGLYFMPFIDPASPTKKQDMEKMWTNNVGKPWAMIFYHKSQQEMNMCYMLMGLLYTLIASLITSLVLFYGSFTTFNARFLVSMGFAIFTLCQGVLDSANWFSYPWSFVKPEIIDLTLGWGICSAWFAWYFKK